MLKKTTNGHKLTRIEPAPLRICALGVGSQSSDSEPSLVGRSSNSLPFVFFSVHSWLHRIVLRPLCLLTFWSTVGTAQVNIWLSDPGNSVLFQQQSASVPFDAVLNKARGSQSTQSATNEHPTIEVDDTQSYQSIVGFGCCLTGGSAMHLIQMDAANRKA